MPDLVLIAHDIRSCHNVGSLLRTADGLGLTSVYLTGYTPYPPLAVDDPRLPHIASKLGRQIQKTALGAEASVTWSVETDAQTLMARLHADGYRLVALEQAVNAIPLPEYVPSGKTALLIGREVEGIDPELLKLVDDIVEIPMFGRKESFNVVQATAIALYALRLPA